jgi:GT2 family glycosyltransferase
METNYSFVTIGYKSLINIKNRVNDVYNGDNPPKEFILIINYYSDISWDILEYAKNESKITRYVFNSQNIGFAKAMNLGVSLSKSEYIIISNDDCSSEQSTYISLVNELNKNSVGLSCVDYGTRKEDLIDVPLGFLLGIKKSMINNIGNYLYDEDASPLGDEIELTYRANYYGYFLSKCNNNLYNHVFDISSNPTDMINYLGENMSPQGKNAFQFKTIRNMNNKINYYKNKLK